jgi:hypothetical protein
MIKFSKIFHAPSSEANSFCKKILPTDLQRKFLLQCQIDIHDDLVEKISAATVASLGMDKPVKPKFRVQGSWKYDTCVQPAHASSQEMDLDYGIYLPMHVLEEGGTPKFMAKAYFVLVERLLQNLCNQKKWHMETGKNTCIRIKVATWAHIDIPLYAVPEVQFAQIKTEASSFTKRTMDSVIIASEQFNEADEQAWDDLNGVSMATREGEWKSSDPEAVAKWFKDRVLENGVDGGAQLRRVCRYLKAWRDYHWTGAIGSPKSPSSVAIMLAVAPNFMPQPKRDDMALLKAAECFARKVVADIRVNALDNGEENFNQLQGNEQLIAQTKANDLIATLRRAQALSPIAKQAAISALMAQFGERIPDIPDHVEIDDGAHAIRATPATVVSVPVVKATSAG